MLIIISSSLVQLEKARVLIVSIFEGIVIVVNALHKLNAAAGKLVNPVDNVRLVRPEQPENTELPRLVMVFGSVRLVRPEQF